MDESVKILGELWGAPGVIIGLMTLVIGYLYREKDKAQKQHSADMAVKDKEHSIEIAQWVKLVLEIQEKRLAENQHGSTKLVDVMHFAEAIARSKAGQS